MKRVSLIVSVWQSILRTFLGQSIDHSIDSNGTPLQCGTWHVKLTVTCRSGLVLMNDSVNHFCAKTLCESFYESFHAGIRPPRGNLQRSMLGKSALSTSWQIEMVTKTY